MPPNRTNFAEIQEGGMQRDDLASNSCPPVARECCETEVLVIAKRLRGGNSFWPASGTRPAMPLVLEQVVGEEGAQWFRLNES